VFVKRANNTKEQANPVKVATKEQELANKRLIMCNKPRLTKGSAASRIDPCMKNIIIFLEDRGVKTLACCCGHKKYPVTIVADIGGCNKEIFSWKNIPRKKRFYQRDKQGYYYIPETL